MSLPATEPHPVRESQGVTTAWMAGLVLACVGFGLAVVSLTLPWIAVQVPSSLERHVLSVVGLASYGPMYAVLLVISAVGAAVGFVVGRRGVLVVQLAAVVTAPAPAVVGLFFGLRPSTQALTDALPQYVTEGPLFADVVATEDLPVTPLTGLALYLAGLLLLGLGLAVAVLNPAGRHALSPTPGLPMSPRRRTWVRAVALGLAVPSAVLSVTLAWFVVEGGNTTEPAALAGWRSSYRVGLIGALLLLLGTALSGGAAQRVLRAAGLYVAGGLMVLLALNALLVWDPSGLTQMLSIELELVRLGPAYFAGLCAAPLLLVVLATSAPVEVPAEPVQDVEDDGLSAGAEA